MGAVIAALLAGCENHVCDPSAETWGLDGGQGGLVPGSTTTWESNPYDGDWVPYLHQSHVVFDYSAYFPSCIAVPTSLTVAISADQNPYDTDAGNYVTGGGNLEEYVTEKTPGKVTMYNNTCADYFMYVAVNCAGMTTAEADAAGTSDGSSDAAPHD